MHYLKICYNIINGDRSRLKQQQQQRHVRINRDEVLQNTVFVMKIKISSVFMNVLAKEIFRFHELPIQYLLDFQNISPEK